MPSHGPAPRVRAAAAFGLCEAVRQAGAEPQALLLDCRLRERDFAEPLAWLDLAAYCDLLERVADRCDAPTFGWCLGLAHGACMLGDFTDLVETAPTLATGLDAVTRAFGFLQERSVLAITRRGRDVVVSYQIRDGRIVRRRQDAELTLGALIGLLRRTLGAFWRPSEIQLEHAAVGRGGLPGSLRGTPVYGGRRANAVVLPVETLATVLPSADPLRHATLVRRAGRELPDRAVEDFVGTVLQHIRDGLAGGQPGLAALARTLGMSGPALYRRLAACGVDYSGLQRALRRELALAQLSDSHVPLTEIALLLGYSELSAFSRAFRSWTGMSPQAYRRGGGAP